MFSRILSTFLLCAIGTTAFAETDIPPTIEVDADKPLANEPDNEEEDRVYQSFGEWEVDEKVKWDAKGASLNTTDGVLTLAAEAGDTPAMMTVTLEGDDRTDLDLGYNDWLLIRCKVAKDFHGGIQFHYTTAFETSFDEEKSFEIPADTLVKDGRFHTYLLDLGLERRWRSYLTGLRVAIEPAEKASSQQLAIDFLRVGDLEGDYLKINTKLALFPDEKLEDCERVLSKHYALWWSPEANRFLEQIAPGRFKGYGEEKEMQRTTFRMMEETYQHMIKVQKYNDPFIDYDGKVEGRHKMNVTTWHHGGFGSMHEGFPIINIHGPSMVTDEALNPVRHELGHSIQTTMPGFLNGPHWESHCGYMHVNLALYWGEVTDLGEPLNGKPLQWMSYVDKTVFLSPLMFEWPGFVYADRRPYWYLDNDPDGFGFKEGFVADIWRTGKKHENFDAALLRELPEGVSYKDVALGWSRRWPFFDRTNGEELYEHFWTQAQANDPARTTMKHRWGHILTSSPDKPGHFRSTLGSSPMKLGYGFYELERPESGEVEVSLELFDLPGKGEDVRWCLVGYDGKTGARYSGFWKPGESHAWQLEPQETQLWLVVAGTPDDPNYQIEYFQRENVLNFDKHLNRLRYGFEVSMKNTRPKPKSIDLTYYDLGPGKPHPNGGGFVEDTAQVESSVYVGPNARVLGRSRVTDNARIEGYATVVDGVVSDDARVSDSALVYGDQSEVTGHARLRGRSMLTFGADVRDNAMLSDHASLGVGQAYENAILRGLASTYGGEASGHAIFDGDYLMNWTAKDGVHKSNIPWGDFYWDYYAKWLEKPRGLVAWYRLEEPDGQMLWDTFGALHGLIRGKVSRAHDPRMAAPMLNLTGETYVVLDSSIADSAAMTFTAFVKPAGRNDNATLLYLGHEGSPSIQLVPCNKAGKPTLTITPEGGESIVLTGDQPLSTQSWTQLGFTLDGEMARLFVNGREVASKESALRPYETVSPNIQEVGQANYVGRSLTGGEFKGSVTGLAFFNVAYSADEMSDWFQMRGRLLKRMLTDKAESFDGSKVLNSGIVSPEQATISAAVRVDKADDVEFYRPIFDSRGNRDEVPGESAPGLGVDAGQYVVYLQGVGRWETGVKCEVGKWQEVALSYDHSHAVFYISGRKVADRKIEQPWPRENTFQIGGSIRLDTGFIGEIRNVQIFDAVLSEAEVGRLTKEPRR